MVLFSNINLNQNVEVSFENQILRGTVRYKGAIKGQAGDWVGVELDEPSMSKLISIHIPECNTCGDTFSFLFFSWKTQWPIQRSQVL